jgi:hypothetical protein
MVLMEYAPLSQLTNDYLSALNELRVMVPAELVHPLGDFLSSHVFRIAFNICDIEKTLSTSSNPLSLLGRIFGNVYLKMLL